MAEAGRLVGISSWRVGAWLKGYDYSYKTRESRAPKFKKQRPVVLHNKNQDETFASFLDLADLFVVNKFLELKFSLQHIRKALDEAREVFEVPHFASSRFYTLGKKIIFDKNSDAKHLYTLLTGGQLAFPKIVEQLADKIELENVNGFDLAARLFPLGKSGKIVLDPQISYGRPTIIGKGTRTANIYDLYQGEQEQIEAVSFWFELPPEDIRAAVKFEQSLQAA